MARERVVYALNVRGDKVFPATVETVHFEKNLGVAEISEAAAKVFCRRHYPDKYEKFCRTCRSDQYPIVLDFESVLTHLEGMTPYHVGSRLEW